MLLRKGFIDEFYCYQASNYPSVINEPNIFCHPEKNQNAPLFTFAYQTKVYNKYKVKWYANSRISSGFDPYAGGINLNLSFVAIGFGVSLNMKKWDFNLEHNIRSIEERGIWKNRSIGGLVRYKMEKWAINTTYAHSLAIYRSSLTNNLFLYNNQHTFNIGFEYFVTGFPPRVIITPKF